MPRRGAAVLAHGYHLGVAHHGGYAEYARLPSEWVVPLPPGLTAPARRWRSGRPASRPHSRSQRLEARGVTPADGPVLVTGATGGVGSSAVAIRPSAATRSRPALARPTRPTTCAGSGRPRCCRAPRPRPSESAARLGALGGRGRLRRRVDARHVLRTLRYGGAVAASGLTGGAALATTVMPFILRGVALLGVDSVHADRAAARAVGAARRLVAAASSGLDHLRCRRQGCPRCPRPGSGGDVLRPGGGAGRGRVSSSRKYPVRHARGTGDPA